MWDRGVSTCRRSALTYLPFSPHNQNQTTNIDLAYAKAVQVKKFHTIVSNGYLGSRNDEERSEMRYVMRIAEFSESSNL